MISARIVKLIRLSVVILSVCVFAFGCSKGTPEVPIPTTENPSVVLISLCSVRADHLSCYGYQRTTSPRIDAFARDATLFEDVTTQWPKTAPSFVSVHTGAYPHTTGVMRITPRQYVDDKFDTLAETFKEAGFATAAFVTTAALHKPLNLTQGFDTYEEVFRLEPMPHCFAQAVALAAEWMDAHKDQRFFLWVHLNNAHLPYRPYVDLQRRFEDDQFYDKRIQLRRKREWLGLVSQDNHPFAEQINRPDLGFIHSAAVLRGSSSLHAYYVASYDQCILGADRDIGTMLDRIEQAGLKDKAVIALLSDHGEAMGRNNYFFEHGRFPYQDCARVPMIVRAETELPHGKRVTEPVALMDVGPTLLELAGVPIPEQFEAKSLVDVVQGTAQRGDIFAASGYQMDFTLSMRRGDWKLIYVPNPVDQRLQRGTAYELYDIAKDPAEANNLVEAEPGVFQELKQALKAWYSPWYAAAQSVLPALDPRATDPETMRLLEAMGYIGGDTKATPPSDSDTAPAAGQPSTENAGTDRNP